VVIRQVRASAALLAFVNALAVSVFGLVPGNAAGYPAAIMGVIGILVTAAGVRSILSSPSTLHQRRPQCHRTAASDRLRAGNSSEIGTPASSRRSPF
jgi:hypothetical protein